MSHRRIARALRLGAPLRAALGLGLAPLASAGLLGAAVAAETAQETTVVVERRHVETQEIRHVVAIDEAADAAPREPVAGAVRLDAALRPDGYVGRIGVVYAPFGDLFADGFRLRAGALGARLDIDRDGVGGTDLEILAAEILLGYDFFLDGWRLGAFVGPEVARHNDSPDDLALDGRGLDYGAKVVGQVERVVAEPLYFGVNAELGSAKGGYDLRLRAGWSLPHVTFGPEVAAFGDRDAAGLRAGAFVEHVPFGEVTLSGGLGFARVDERGGGGRDADAGVYATLGLTAPF